MPTAPRFPVTVAGVATGPAGGPLAGVFLSFQSAERELNDYAFAITGPSGTYSVDLHKGTYQVRAEAPGPGFLTRYERISISERHARVDFAFSGFRVTGRILDPNGIALDSGLVNARLSNLGSALSGLSQGTYSLLLPAGTYTFAAGPADYWSGLPFNAWESVRIASDTTIDLRLEGIPVSGRVLGPDGLPMGGVRVEPYAEGHPGPSRCQTGVDGDYRLYVPRGTYTFHFGCPYPVYIIPRLVGPQTIEAPASVDCDLSGVEWSGTVRRSDDNEPVSGLTVLVRMLEDPDQRAAAITNGAQGEFRFVMEPNRRYDLLAYDPSVHAEVARVPGITATVDTTFELLVPPSLP